MVNGSPKRHVHPKKALPVELEDALDSCMLKDQVVLRQQVHQGKISIEKLKSRIEHSKKLLTKRSEFSPHISYPETLPVSSVQTQIKQLLKEHQVIVVAGETGSGKTTQLPKMCWEAGFGRKGSIGITQPRRVAATSTANRLAEETQTTLGKEVGYKIRFYDKTTPETILKVMTDGILLQELHRDRKLLAYDCLIIDEAHERSLNIDFLLGVLRRLLSERKDLRCIITSATINTTLFSQAFDNCPVLEIGGRTHPVDLVYEDLLIDDFGKIDYQQTIKSVVTKVLAESDHGDILVFLPTERDINDLTEDLSSLEADVFPLYSRLSFAQQQLVFKPSRKRKVILATNIAETSITIPGIVYVVDAGLARIARYDHRSRTLRLPVEKVSQSSLSQRAGRAGRVEPGVCFRLFPEEGVESRRAFTEPEIQRANLAQVILQFKYLGLGSWHSFPFLEKPNESAYRGGEKVLQELGAITSQGVITQIGKRLASLPIDPVLGRMIIQAQKEHCVKEMLVIVTGLSIADVREKPTEKKEEALRCQAKFLDGQSDFLLLLNIWNAAREYGTSRSKLSKFCREHFLSFSRMREWQDLHFQLTRSLKERQNKSELDSEKTETEDARYRSIHRCILAGLVGQVGLRLGPNVYKVSGNKQIRVFPGSCMSHKKDDKKAKGFLKWIVIAEFLETSQRFGCTVAPVQVSWIWEFAKHLCKIKYGEPRWSRKAGKVLVKELYFLHGELIKSERINFAKVDPDRAREIFIREGLVLASLPEEFTFIHRNRELVDEALQFWASRRNAGEIHPEERLYELYAKALPSLSSVHKFRQWYSDVDSAKVRLDLSKEEVLPPEVLAQQRLDYPEFLLVGGEKFACEYVYAPGTTEDGVILSLPQTVKEDVTLELVFSLVPGIRREVLKLWLKQLPKKERKLLVPLPDTVERLLVQFPSADPAFFSKIADEIHKWVKVDIGALKDLTQSLPAHLVPGLRFTEISSKNLQSISQDKEGELENIQNLIPSRRQSSIWFERAKDFSQPLWDKSDLPLQVTMYEIGSWEQKGWYGLVFKHGSLGVQVYPSALSALDATEEAIHNEGIGELKRDISRMTETVTEFNRSLFGSLVPVVKGSFDLIANLLNGYVFPIEESFLPIQSNNFDILKSEGRKRIGLLHQQFGETLRLVETEGKRIKRVKGLTTEMQQEIARLLPYDLLKQRPYVHLIEYPRILRSLWVRIDRGIANPGRYKQLYLETEKYLRQFREKKHSARKNRALWLLSEEYRMRVFTPEIKAPFGMTLKRIKENLERDFRA